MLAVPGPTGDVTLYSATQIPHILRLLAAATLGLRETKVRVVAPDVGGGFGSKLDVYAEELLALALARRLDRPVKWTEERSENYVATIHGRDFVTEYTLAATKDGTITHCRARVTRRDGRLPPARHARDPAARRVDLRGAVRDPELQRRVHGRLHEHDADGRVPRGRAARGDVRDRADDGRARRRARHGQARAAPQELHHGVPAHARVGADDRLGRLRRVARQAPRAARPRRAPGGAGEAARQRRARSSSASASRRTTRCAGSRRRASSARSATRRAAGSRPRSATCRPARSQVITGTSPHGQGHETAWAQIVADQLGCDIDAVEVLHGDTSISHDGARHATGAEACPSAASRSASPRTR